MTPKPLASRLFILADHVAVGEPMTSWVQIKLTDQFLDRVLELHSLLVHHELESASALIDANWTLESNWHVDNCYLPIGSRFLVYDFGFSVECIAYAKSDSTLKSLHRTFQATYIWGYISELVEDWRPTTDFPPGACYEKSSGWESLDEEIAFRNVVLSEL